MDSIAEVIESSTRHVVAEVARGRQAPTFGSWVEVPAQDGTVLYARVSHVETGSVEPGRRAMALGMDRATLQREMPQLQELIRTTNRALILAYREAPRPGAQPARLRQTLPPRPADLHDMVHPCHDATVCALGDHSAYEDGSCVGSRSMSHRFKTVLASSSVIGASRPVARASAQADDDHGQGQRKRLLCLASR